MFRRFCVQKVLCSENICSKGSMFRSFYIQKVLYSEGHMLRRSYVQKKMFKRSYIQKVLFSEGPIFRYIQKVLYSENSLFYVEKTYRSDELLSWRVVRRLSVHNLPKSLLGLQSTWWTATNQEWSQKDCPRDSGIWHYCRSGNFRVFKFSQISDFGTFHFCSAIIIIIFARFWKLRMSSPREIRDN